MRRHNAPKKVALATATITYTLIAGLLLSDLNQTLSFTQTINSTLVERSPAQQNNSPIWTPEDKEALEWWGRGQNNEPSETYINLRTKIGIRKEIQLRRLKAHEEGEAIPHFTQEEMNSLFKTSKLFQALQKNSLAGGYKEGAFSQGFKHAIQPKRLGAEMATFYTAIATIDYWKCVTEKDPTFCKTFVDSMIHDPLHHIGFMLFMISSGVVNSVMSMHTSFRKFAQLGGYLGMTAGMMVQDLFTEIVSNPYTKALLETYWSASKINSYSAEERVRVRRKALDKLFEMTVRDSEWWWTKGNSLVSMILSSVASTITTKAAVEGWKLTGIEVGHDLELVPNRTGRFFSRIHGSVKGVDAGLAARGERLAESALPFRAIFQKGEGANAVTKALNMKFRGFEYAANLAKRGIIGGLRRFPLSLLIDFGVGTAVGIYRVQNGSGRPSHFKSYAHSFAFLAYNENIHPIWIKMVDGTRYKRRITKGKEIVEEQMRKFLREKNSFDRKYRANEELLSIYDKYDLTPEELHPSDFVLAHSHDRLEKELLSDTAVKAIEFDPTMPRDATAIFPQTVQNLERVDPQTLFESLGLKLTPATPASVRSQEAARRAEEKSKDILKLFYEKEKLRLAIKTQMENYQKYRTILLQFVESRRYTHQAELMKFDESAQKAVNYATWIFATGADPESDFWKIEKADTWAAILNDQELAPDSTKPWHRPEADKEEILPLESIPEFFMGLSALSPLYRGLIETLHQGWIRGNRSWKEWRLASEVDSYINGAFCGAAPEEAVQNPYTVDFNLLMNGKVLPFKFLEAPEKACYKDYPVNVSMTKQEALRAARAVQLQEIEKLKNLPQEDYAKWEELYEGVSTKINQVMSDQEQARISMIDTYNRVVQVPLLEALEGANYRSEGPSKAPIKVSDKAPLLQGGESFSPSLLENYENEKEFWEGLDRTYRTQTGFFEQAIRATELKEKETRNLITYMRQPVLRRTNPFLEYLPLNKDPDAPVAGEELGLLSGFFLDQNPCASEEGAQSPECEKWNLILEAASQISQRQPTEDDEQLMNYLKEEGIDIQPLIEGLELSNSQNFTIQSDFVPKGLVAPPEPKEE